MVGASAPTHPHIPPTPPTQHPSMPAREVLSGRTRVAQLQLRTCHFEQARKRFPSWLRMAHAQLQLSRTSTLCNQPVKPSGWLRRVYAQLLLSHACALRSQPESTFPAGCEKLVHGLAAEPHVCTLQPNGCEECVHDDIMMCATGMYNLAVDNCTDLGAQRP